MAEAVATVSWVSDGDTWTVERLADGSVRLSWTQSLGTSQMVQETRLPAEAWCSLMATLFEGGLTPVNLTAAQLRYGIDGRPVRSTWFTRDRDRRRRRSLIHQPEPADLPDLDDEDDPTETEPEWWG